MNICTRQTALIGPANQKKLANASVAIIGVGALGSASAHLLARMGIGKLIICDDDIVADHNLGRQHLYVVTDIGKKKVVALKKHLLAIRPDIQVEICDQRITSDNISCCDEAQIVVDGTDNHATRRCIDKYVKQRGISWVHGAAIEDKGTVIFFPTDLSYNDIYDDRSKEQHCEISGVLATTTTLVATMQTQMVFLSLTQQDIPRLMYRLSGLTWSQVQI